MQINKKEASHLFKGLIRQIEVEIQDIAGNHGGDDEALTDMLILRRRFLEEMDSPANEINKKEPQICFYKKPDNYMHPIKIAIIEQLKKANCPLTMKELANILNPINDKDANNRINSHIYNLIKKGIVENVYKRTGKTHIRSAFVQLKKQAVR